MTNVIPKPHNNNNFRGEKKLRNGERNRELDGRHHAARPSSADGPYKAGTDASFRRR